MSLTRKLVENTMAGDIPTCMAFPSRPMVMARQLNRKKKRSRLAQKLVKEAEEPLFTKDAVEIDAKGITFVAGEDVGDPIKSVEQVVQPKVFLDTQLALVAPDVTPNSRKELDPSMVPQPATPVIDLLTGGPRPAGVQTAAAESVTLPDVTSMLQLSESQGPEVGGALGVAGLPTGDMPAPTSGNVAAITQVFRKFGGGR